jgi:hypothetical protein
VPVAKVEAAQPIPVAKSCCHRETSQKSQPKSSPENAPCQTPERNCCCEYTATTPPAPEKATQDFAPTLSHSLDVSPALAIHREAVEITAFVISTPSLQILHCVWRC